MNSTKSSEEYLTILKQTVLKEKSLIAKLSYLPNDFYKKLRIELAQLKGKQFDQTALLLSELFRIRHSKIVQFASVTPLTKSIKNNLTDEELSYYDSLDHLTQELKQSIISVSHFCIYHYGEKRFGRKCLCGIVFCDDEDCIVYHTLECDVQKIHTRISIDKPLVISKPTQNRLVDKQYLIDTNRIILEEFQKKHPSELISIGVRSEIDDIISEVEKYGHSGNDKKDLIEKAAYLMGIISWSQPFLDGNKRTGIVSAIKLLRDNGYRLKMEQKDEKEIRGLLYDIQDQRSCINKSIIEKIIIYTTRRVIPYESR